MITTGDMPVMQVTRGDGVSFALAFFLDTEETQPLNVSAYSVIKMEVRNAPNAEGTLIDGCSLADGITVMPEPQQNVVNFDLKEFDHPAGKYYYDVRMQETPESAPLTIVRGVITVTENITVL